jgi:hypothetical protein
MGMALELKGLKGKAIAARSNIERLNAAYDVFNEKAPAHASDVEGMATPSRADERRPRLCGDHLGKLYRAVREACGKPNRFAAARAQSHAGGRAKRFDLSRREVTT